MVYEMLYILRFSDSFGNGNLEAFWHKQDALKRAEKQAKENLPYFEGECGKCSRRTCGGDDGGAVLGLVAQDGNWMLWEIIEVQFEQNPCAGCVNEEADRNMDCCWDCNRNPRRKRMDLYKPCIDERSTT